MNIHVYHITTKWKHSELTDVLYNGCFIFPFHILFSLMLIMVYFHLFAFFVLNTNSVLPSYIMHLLLFARILYVIQNLSSPRNLSQSFLTKFHQLEGLRALLLIPELFWVSLRSLLGICSLQLGDTRKKQKIAVPVDCGAWTAHATMAGWGGQAPVG